MEKLIWCVANNNHNRCAWSLRLEVWQGAERVGSVKGRSDNQESARLFERGRVCLEERTQRLRCQGYVMLWMLRDVQGVKWTSE